MSEQVNPEKVISAEELKESWTWVRSEKGLLAGICQSVAEKLKTEPWIIRLMFLFSVLFFGTGLLIYLYLWIALPRRDRLDLARGRKILGVCAKISLRSGHEVGLVRLAALLIATVTFGTTFLVYMLIWVLENLTNENFIGTEYSRSKN